MLQIVDSELGAAEITDDALWRAGRWKAYLFSSSRRVVGFLLAERIQRGYVARGGASGAVVMGEERPALLGVCRIWTAGEWRRRGVARRLLEEARQEFVYGLKVGRELVAFSQPTESGAALARGWWGELREVHGNKENGKEKAETDETEDKGERGEGWLVYVEQD
ncbi:ESCO1/2 acetyl-transferase-domain-containing protein [Tricharina praecox]|uniref:ESCO1/2 acetyl-transferase-domain-containing protein n=1 Tax=Tricharina praecox TaxID=43433 RepID=UPI00222056A3|nr:ESCO1/2 acetyl-transferase-domain-containing protein [Tricharina praecox]KAI5858097.1 ESCO1/2 acetyl-transferase-domain-containing protein [Tricharina praecox]